MSHIQLPPDDKLLSLLVQGNQQAFETIYRRYVKYLFAFARKNIPHREDCEEIVQEVFTYLWENRQKLQHIENLQAYLTQMVRYKVIRYFKRSLVQRKYAEHYRLFEAVYETGAQPQLQAEPNALRRAIENALTGLPKRAIQAIRLRLSEDLSSHEIAKLMNVSHRTVENYLTLAHQHLRQHLILPLEGE